MRDPIVTDPAGFDVDAAWGRCKTYVDECGGLSHDDDGSPNWKAAAGADPGCCSCPRCHEHYWAWGSKQRCVACGAEYETEWWSMLSWGVQHGRIIADTAHPMYEYHRRPGAANERYASRSAVFRWGAEHPDCSLDSRIVFRGTNWIAVWAGQVEYVKDGTMVGGKVIGLVRGDADTLLNVEDNRASGGGKHHDVCAVRCVELEDEKVAVGDSVWWQAGNVYWTPTRFRRTVDADRWQDVPLKKVGYSH